MTTAKPTPQFFRTHQKSGDVRREPVCISHRTTDGGTFSTGYAAEAHPRFASLLIASANSYAAHFSDPVAAAEADMLGDAVKLLRLAIDEMCTATFTKGVDRRGLNYAIDKARALLAQTKEPTP